MKRYTPSPSNPWNEFKAAHLLRRTVIGATPQEIQTAASEGVEATIKRLFTPFKPPLGMIAGWAGNEPQAASPPEGPLYDAWFWEIVGRRTGLNQWWMQTMVQSPISLQERMVLFWHGHFTTSFAMVQYAEIMYTQHQLLRRSVWGNFKQFVKDITTDRAMLIFLNGNDNFKTAQTTAINENYARELMELFTMGIRDRNGSPNYTQRDVHEAARALTGWKPLAGSDDKHESLYSVWYPWFWDDGEKTIFGKTGRWKAMDVIDILFSERAEQIAHFICRKLYRWFVCPEQTAESEVVVAELAQTFRAANWELRPVIEQILTSEVFFAPENAGCMPKSGIEYMVGLLKMLNVQNIPDFQATKTLGERWNTNDMLLRMESMGHLLFFPPSVAGWADGRNWVHSSALAARLKNATNIALGSQRYRDQWDICYTIDPIAFARQFADRLHKPNDARGLVQAMAAFLLSQPPSAEEESTLLEVLLDGGADYEWSLDNPAQRPTERIRKCLAAIMNLPKFQLQ
jgi:hypothetical protein